MQQKTCAAQQEAVKAESSSAPEPTNSPVQPSAPVVSYAFFAAGKGYIHTSQLTSTEDKDGFARDCYGRLVLHVRERFPCFDSYDLLYENRYFHWYLLYDQGAWAIVKTQDDSTEVTVQEDLSFEQAASILYSKEKNAEALMKRMETGQSDA